MTVALILLACIVGVGSLLYLTDRRHPQPPSAAVTDEAEGCCGMHITCEKDSLLASVSETIEYYDDEELDVYAGRTSGSYDASDSEAFRDVLLSMRPEDIAGWARSLQLRGIELPGDVRDELLLIVSEARSTRERNAAVSRI